MDESSFLNPGRALAAADLHPGMRVADLAAGSGFFTRAAARVVAPGEVWAVDADPALLVRIKNIAEQEGLRNIEVMQGDIERAGGSHLPNAHFDAVLLVNALFSARHKSAVAQEVHRILKRSGIAVVIDWSDSHGGLGPHPDHVAAESQVCTIFEDAGFVRQGTVPAGAYHWGLIMRKK